MPRCILDEPFLVCLDLRLDGVVSTTVALTWYKAVHSLERFARSLFKVCVDCLLVSFSETWLGTKTLLQRFELTQG